MTLTVTIKIETLSIMTLTQCLSIMPFIAYASVIMLNVVMLSVVMPSVVVLSVIMLNVVAPCILTYNMLLR